MSSPSPVSATEETEPYWAAIREGRFVLPYDLEKNSWVWPPAGGSLEWRAVSDRGRIASFSIVHRAPSAINAHPEPYIIAFVTLEQGPRLFTRIVGLPVAEARLDLPVSVSFEAIDPDGPLLPVFQPVLGDVS